MVDEYNVNRTLADSKDHDSVKDTALQNNLFHQIAQTLWSRGEDGEEIARDLASALAHVIKEGVDRDPVEEFRRLITP